jgi:parallel beta-helix repeat protein
MKSFAAFFFTGIVLLAVPPGARADISPVPLKRGMLITSSVTIKKELYRFKGFDDPGKGVIVISGKHIVVDFNGAVLQGSPDDTRPDAFYGVALYIKEGTDVTIKNARIRGYKIAMLGRDAQRLTIENCDLSNNFRQHLNSDRFREDLSDWQSYHNNEKDQWMRFGAGIYLRDCDSITIKDNVITQGQCGLMMTHCNRGLVYNNNFSFNSGIGIGMYRSSYNRVMNNKLDWNIRGFSDGYYYRGQDAAAILVYEQSSHNVFAYNSATHSGDGFFLWAGNSTLETGEGGCNDNLIYGNDFSFAPTNGVETTFSRNKIINNKIEGCDNGIWAGYSYQSLIQGNLFKDNNTGIAIEQGQDNRITGNIFSGGRMGIHLWATPGRRMEGQYDAKRDVRSMNYVLENNSFSSLGTVFAFSHSRNIRVQNNLVAHSAELLQLDSSVENIYIKRNGGEIKLKKGLSETDEPAPGKIEGARDAMLPAGHLQGRKYMMITPWGPYDFRSPILWWTKTDASGRMYFDILGPEGRWKIKEATGAENLSAASGTVPGALSFDKKGNEPVAVELEYTGAEVTSPFGKKFPAGSPYVFGYRKAFLPQSWKVQLFSFGAADNPVRHPDAFSKMIHTSAPIMETTVPALNNDYWSTQGKKVPPRHTAMVASSTINFPQGKYIIGTSASEMVRVYIDDKRVIDAWDASKIVYDADYHHEATLSLKGQHTIRVEQAQLGGYGMLYLTITPEEEFTMN